MSPTQIRLFLLVVAGILSVPALADSSTKPRSKRRIASLPSEVRTETQARDLYTDEQTGTGFTLFLGLGGGSVSVSPSEQAGGIKASGTGVFGRSAVAFHNRNLALELGFNWMQSRVQGDAISIVGATTRTTATEVFTRVGILEFSPRFRLTDRFELGPVGSAFFGTQAAFGGPNDSGVHTPVFLGLKATASFGKPALPIRAIVQASQSVTIPDRGVFVLSAGLEVGLPIFRGRTVIRERETITTRENYHRETIEQEKVVVRKVVVPVEKIVEKEKVVVQERVVFNFDDQLVNFEFDKATLQPDSADFLREFGAFLASRPDAWGRLKIEGHTDTRGTPEYNQRLSDNRVTSVREVFTAAGVPSDRIEAVGKGLTQPIDTSGRDIAHARNRRVEMSFTDVSDAAALREAVNKIKLKYYKPSTCGPDGCK